MINHLSKFVKKAQDEGIDEAIRGLNRFFIYRIDSLYNTVNSRYFEYMYGPGCNVMSKDWDNLYMLDACRYDYFEEQIDLNGKLDSVISKGNYSWEFMQKNFVGQELHDTVYVTANPYSQRLSEDVFYTVESVLDSWDSDIGTVPPSEVTDAAIEAHDTYPNKRLIVHFMQPHQPHLGRTAEKIRKKRDIRGWDKYHGIENQSSDQTGIRQWDPVLSGEVSDETIQQSYAETLDIVLQYVSELIETIPGQSVITSDHGELLGERSIIRKRYGHPREVNIPELRKVPYFVIESESRRECFADNPIGFEKARNEVVEEQLKALGYKN